jgi:hypothetical protein
MIELNHARYHMDLGCGSDTWRIIGEALNHPVYGNLEVQPSTPVSCDKSNRTFESASGKNYHVLSFSMPEDKFWEQVEKDILNKGYEVK